MERKMENEINKRIAKISRLYNIVKSNFEIVKRIIKSTLTYACEFWTLSQRQMNRLTSVEMKFLLKRIYCGKEMEGLLCEENK